MTTETHIIDVWLSILAVDFLRYLIPASAFFGLVWLARKLIAKYRIQDTAWATNQYVREIALSASTAFIFSLIGTGLFWAIKAGWTQIYTDDSRFGAFYYYASFFVLMVLHDTWFYWTHRLMHTKPLYRFFHKAHHLSKSPSPWAAYAFAPGEAVVQALFYVIMMFAIPFHPNILFGYLIFMIVRNIWGHMGYELLPRWFHKTRLTSFSTTATHHDMHHELFNQNFALYFRWWDKLMKTEHPDYLKRFDANAKGKSVNQGEPLSYLKGVLH